MSDKSKNKNFPTDSHGALYLQKVDGNNGKVADMDLVEAKIKEPEKARPGAYMYSYKFSTYRDFLSLTYGFKVTNNWLKIHGGIMERRCGKRKRYPAHTNRPRMKRRDLKRKKRRFNTSGKTESSNLTFILKGGGWQGGSYTGQANVYPPTPSCTPGRWLR